MGGNERVRTAVIPAAGIGTRMLPATKSIPKELLPVVDRPIIHYIVDEILSAGIKNIIFVVSRGKESLLDYFDINKELEGFLSDRKKEDLLENIREISRRIEIISIRQKEPKGLGHAVLTAKELVKDEPFAVLLPDDIVDSKKGCLEQLLEYYEPGVDGIIALERVPEKEVSRYGIVKGVQKTERLWKIQDLIEKPAMRSAPSNLAVIGRYILPPEVFDVLERTEPGSGGEIQLTDALRVVAKGTLLGLEFEGRRYDLGNPKGFVKANVAFGMKDPDIRDWIKKQLTS